MTQILLCRCHNEPEGASASQFSRVASVTSFAALSKKVNRLLLQLHHKHPTFRCVHALLHGASRLKHRCFEVGHSREHLLKTTTPWNNAALGVGILRNLNKFC